jgi:hypothetical protein
MLVLPTTYRSNPVIPFAPNADADRAHQWDWPGNVNAIPSGLTIAWVDPTNGIESITLGYVGLTRSDARTLEAFVETQLGRKAGFWCPTFQHDYVAVDHISGHPSGTFALREWGQATLNSTGSIFDIPGDEFRHVAAFCAGTVGGSWYFNRMGLSANDPTVGPDGIMLLGYGFAVGGPEAGNIGVLSTLTYQAGLRLMRLLWVRFADDAMTTEWAHPHLAAITLRVVSVPPETP